MKALFGLLLMVFYLNRPFGYFKKNHRNKKDGEREAK
jgi:hypothetical protein